MTAAHDCSVFDNVPDLNIFISYVWDDRQQNVRAMMKYLQTIRQFKVYTDNDALLNPVGEGDDKSAQVRFPKDLIDSADVVMLFMNQNYVDSLHCQKVAIYAYKHRKLLVPIKLEAHIKLSESVLQVILGRHYEEAVEFQQDELFEPVANALLLNLAKRISALSTDKQPQTLLDLTKFEEELARNLALQEAQIQSIFNCTENHHLAKVPIPQDSTKKTEESSKTTNLSVRLIRILVMQPFSELDGKLADDCESVFKALRNRHLHWSISVSNDDDVMTEDISNSDFVLIFTATGAVDQKLWQSVGGFKKPSVLIHLNIEALPTTGVRLQRFQAECWMGKRPLPSFIDELVETIGHLLVSKCNIPNALKDQYVKRPTEEDQLRSGLKYICQSNSDYILTVYGDSGVGKSSLVGEFLANPGNSNFLAFDCRLQYIVWLNVAKFTASTLQFDDSKIYEFVAEILEQEFAHIEPKSLFNLTGLFCSERRNYGRFLIILDGYVNSTRGTAVLEALSKLGSQSRFVLISTARNQDAKLYEGNHSQTSVLVNPMRDSQILTLFSNSLGWAIDRSELVPLSKICPGNPVLAKMIDGILQVKLKDCQDVAAIAYCCDVVIKALTANNRAEKLNPKRMAVNLLELAFEKQDRTRQLDVFGLQAYSLFCLYSPGEHVHIGDLAVLLEVEPNSAENLFNSMEQRRLCRRVSPDAFSINELQYKAILDISSSKLDLDQFSKLSKPEVLRTAVKNRRVGLLMKIIAELETSKLDQVCRLKFYSNLPAPDLDEETEGRTFLQLLLNEKHDETILAILSKLETSKSVDVFQTLAEPNERTGNSALLEILFSQQESLGKLKTKVLNLLKDCRRKLQTDQLIELRYWTVEARDRRNSKLFVASIRNEDVLVQHLLNANRLEANMSNPHHGETPLMPTCARGHLKIARMLIAAGADVNARSKDGMTPLMYASKNGHEPLIELIMAMVQEAPDINATEHRHGMSALMFAARFGHLNVVKLLARHPSLKVDLTTPKGVTALMMASAKGHVDVVEELSLLGSNLATLNADGCSALMLASERGHLAVVKFLLDFQPHDLEQQRRDGMTALMLASRSGHEQLVNYLRMNGASIFQTAVGANGQSALMLAAANGHRSVIEVLQQAGVAETINLRDNCPRKATALLLAAESGHASTVQHLVSLGADVNMKDSETGLPALALASKNGHWRIVEFLKAQGSDVNASSQTTGKTALLMAAENGWELCVNVLVKLGARFNHRCKLEKLNALQYAADKGHWSICRYLLDQGSELAYQDSFAGNVWANVSPLRLDQAAFALRSAKPSNDVLNSGKPERKVEIQRKQVRLPSSSSANLA